MTVRLKDLTPYCARTDSTGATVKSYSYDAYGTILESPGTVEQPYTYTGREFDAESGLYYYRARHYDPTVGNFLMRDPILRKGNPLVPYLLHTLLRQPLQLNSYIYVADNPINNTDPQGLGFISCVQIFSQCGKCIEKANKCAEDHGDPIACQERGEEIGVSTRAHVISECFSKDPQCAECGEKLLECGLFPIRTGRGGRL